MSAQSRDHHRDRSPDATRAERERRETEEEDAARLYQQGWALHQVAERFGYTEADMRRVLQRRTVLRHRRGHPD